MKLHIATLGGVPTKFSARNVFVGLAANDVVGRHQLEADAGRADAVLIVDLHQHLDDPFARAVSRHPLVSNGSPPVFVYDERDFPSYTLPGIYISAPRRWGLALPVVGGPYPNIQTFRCPPVGEPDLLFSFRGAMTHRVRYGLLELNHPRAVIEDSGHPRFDGDPVIHTGGVSAQQKYQDLVCRSKFVLCPRGHGPSSFRLYETLAQGRVPVVISDDWLPPPGMPWAECVVSVREDQIALLPGLLESLESEWTARSHNAMAIAERLGRHRLWDYYAGSIEGLMTRTPHRKSTLHRHRRTAHICARILRRRLTP